MEADWNEITRISTGVATKLLRPTTFVFDDNQELLWVGHDNGRVASFFGPDLQRYTSVIAADGPTPADRSIRQLLLHQKGILSLAPRSIHLNNRRGLTQWHLVHEQMTDVSCMSFTANPSQILVAGRQQSMFLVDIEKGEILQELPSPNFYIAIKKSRYLCAATIDGAIDFLDPSTFNLIATWKAPYAAIIDMDARNDLLVICGYTSSHLGQQNAAPFASVYDLRLQKALAPIPFHAGAAYVRLHPRLHTTSFVASQTGQMQVVDLMNPTAVNLRQANAGFVLGMDLSPSGEALAILDHDYFIHLWGSPTKIHFCKLSQETEFPDQQSKVPLVDWQKGSLNSIGMPYYTEKLLSAWPSHLVFDVGAPPSQIDPAILYSLQPAGLGQYALFSRKTRRYQVENTRNALNEASQAAPRFLSEKAKDTPRSRSKAGRETSEISEELASATLNEQGQEEPSLKYGNVEIKYSRFGVDDFDFRFYNKTEFSGLETHITNSYINALLQLYRFTPLLRNIALHHAASSCHWENCLLCELGFLVDMLEKARGVNCQATNLLRSFGASREASNLNLLEQNNQSISSTLSATVQGVNRFFLGQIAHDFRQIAGSIHEVDLSLATVAKESIQCMVCRNEIVRPGTTYVNELIFPNHDLKLAGRHAAFKFSNILKASLERQSQSRGWCENCHRYQQQNFIRRNFQHLPYVLMINASLPNPKTRHIWALPNFLPPEIGILLQGDTLQILEGPDLLARQRSNTRNLVTYELVGYVAEVSGSDHDRPHLVSVINTDISDPESHARSSNSPAWHLLNDFLVSPLSTAEAQNFPLLPSSALKNPSILTYQIHSAHGALDDTWLASLNTTLLSNPYSINQMPPHSSCQPLPPNLSPISANPSYPIALDTEFVEFEPPVFETSNHGSNSTTEMVRPSRTGLARVSVLRGAPSKGVSSNTDLNANDPNSDDDADFATPFIDDYIVTPHSLIHDYKTPYSGIRPGDLDPTRSSHNLVPLKVAYKKLWLLLNLGCVFVGHGLGADFRKVNLQVPKSQVRDTVVLFAKDGGRGGGRLLSLRFLAWCVFGEWIQEEAEEGSGGVGPAGEKEGHDSIVDAAMALRLWRKWEEWKELGEAGLREMIEGVWREGERVRFKPPRRVRDRDRENGKGNGAGGGGIDAPSVAVSGRNTPEVRLSAPGQGVGPVLGESPLR
ncbi:MAG: hypothetical protein Q9160_002062 [Pyrenula sp. 1 TL-2023]